MRHDADTVLVGMHQSPDWMVTPPRQTGLPKLDQPNIGVAHAGVQAEELEPKAPHLVEIAQGSRW